MKILLLHVLLTCLCLAKCAENINKNIILKNVERTIDLASQLVKVSAALTLENTGKESISLVHLLLEPDFTGNLSHIIARDSMKEEIPVKPVQDAKYPNLYRMQLKQGLVSGKTAAVTVEWVLTNALEPYPSAITQKERQFVRYFGNHYFYSPYAVSKQVTNIVVGSRNIESYTKLKPVAQAESTLTYGPYVNIAPLSSDQMVVHYENNAPFLTVTYISRLIEISHWGNIAIHENVEILHTGAKLKGPFSRYDYQRDTSSTHHSIKSYRTILPASAHSIYYRDSNGNISTSQVRNHKEYIELELRPRFPLFGGWKSSYTLGYGVPSYQYLYKTNEGNYMLRMRLLDHVFDDMHIENLETSVVLPVGVSNVQINFPYDVERMNDTVTYKYLDTLGRQVIRLQRKNLVEQHIQDLEIIYDWQTMLLIHEPLLVATALYALFVIVIVYVRLDFSIH